MEKQHLEEAWAKIKIQYGGHISTLRRRFEAIVQSISGLLLCCSFWHLKPKKGAYQNEITVNSLHGHLLIKSIFAFAQINDIRAEAIWQL